MTRALTGVLLSFIASAAFAGVLVTEVNGKAEVDGKGAVTTLSEIPDGARLSLPAGSRVVVVDLGSGREFLLKGGAKYEITAGGPRAKDGVAIEARELPAKNLPDIRLARGKTAQATLVMRGARKANVPVLQYPVRTASISTTPLFRWHAVEGAAHYRVSVMNPGGFVVWQAGTRETELVLPSDKALAPGERYSWKVEALGENGPLADSSTTFSVADAEAINRLSLLNPNADTPYARRILYAALLRDAGALFEAKEMWKALAAERPEDEVLRALAE